MNKKGIAALGLSLMMAGTMLTGCGSGDSDGAGRAAALPARAGRLGRAGRADR